MKKWVVEIEKESGRVETRLVPARNKCTAISNCKNEGDTVLSCVPYTGKNVKVSGQYAKLASYLIKQSDGMLRSQDALQGKRWNSSRNLRKPKVLRKEPVKDKGWYNRIARLPKKLEQSYYLDGDSVQEGIHEKTGYTFFTYTFVKINQTWKETELEWDKL